MKSITLFPALCHYIFNLWLSFQENIEALPEAIEKCPGLIQKPQSE
jgi:hypothetical protein